MKSKQFKCKITILGKTIKYNNEYNEEIYKQVNLFYLFFYKLFIESKNRFFFTNSNNKEYGEPYYKPVFIWIGKRITKLIDNILQVIGAGFIGYLMMNFFNNV